MEKVRTKRNTFDSILNVFAWLSFLIALVLAIAVFMSSFSGTDNGRSIFGYKMLIVRSDSMTKPSEESEEEIFFSSGDLIFIKEVEDFSTIAVGDVITFVSYNPDSVGKTISHKVRSVVTDSGGQIMGFETYGIQTGVSDKAIVDPSTVLGKYVAKSEMLGKVFTYFKTPAGYFTSILTPCVLLIIFFSIKVGKLLEKRAMHLVYVKEFESLREKIDELESKKGEFIMQTDIQNIEGQCATMGDGTAQAQGEQVGTNTQPVVNTQPIIQMATSERALEIMANALTGTIQSLTSTIDSLASTVGKPVDSLVRSVEALAVASAKPIVVEKIVEKPVEKVVEKIVEKPVIQEVIKEVIKEVVVEPVKPVEEVTPVQPVVETPAQAEVVATEVVEESAKGGPFGDFKQIEKVPFNKKLLSLDSEIKEYFSEVHNELISYKKVNYRISFKGITYRLGRKALAKMVVRGKTLKLHLALNVNDFSKTVFFQEDMGAVKAYEDVPFTVKIKSNRAKNNALKLVTSLAELNTLKKDEQFKKENVLKQLKQFK